MIIRNYISLNFFSLKKSLKKIQYFIYLLLLCGSDIGRRRFISVKIVGFVPDKTNAPIIMIISMCTVIFAFYALTCIDFFKFKFLQVNKRSRLMLNCLG